MNRVFNPSRFVRRRVALPSYAKPHLPGIRIMAMSTQQAPLQLKDSSLFQPYPFLDNEFVKSGHTSTFTVTDPSNNAAIAIVPDQTAADCEAAIVSSASAFETFRHTTARGRARLLRKWHDLILENQNDIATLITLENGKPFADALGEVKYAASFVEWFSEEASRIYGDTIPVLVGTNRVVTQRAPIGVCGLICPWNFPAAMFARKIAPALAAGCTVVGKVPPETPLTALALAELARRAEMPPGVINMVTTFQHTPDVGKMLCTHPEVRKISFTGSTPVGRLLMSQASSTIKKCSFELGGNAPFIVFDDADLDSAVSGAITSKFRSSGQTCVCANRIFVQAEIYDEFSKRMAERVSKFRVGSGFEDGVTHGPLIHDRAIEKVAQHVEDAAGHGAQVLVGGQRLPDIGTNFYAPTVLVHVNTAMRIHGEEIFGPVAPLFKFETEKEVVEMANDTEVGLAAYFFSEDVKRVWRVAEALEVGMVGVNTGLISDPAAPFGGVKQSGFGREGSKYGIDEYTTVKTITFGGVGELQG